ncbi:MAG: STAS domain-containing protein [Pirellulales bacterium]
MTQLATGWDYDLERGPQCLFVRLHNEGENADAEPPLAQQLWATLDEHMTYRLVLELDQVEVLRSYLIGQLLLLGRRLHARGGTLRLCGLSPHNREALAAVRLEDHLPTYENRYEAIVGF